MDNKILIVDDEQPVRHMLRRLLESCGYVTCEAGNGQEGLAVDAKERPDLVLTDLKMPAMDGLEMAQEMILKNADRPVLLMTAYADLDSARKALQVGIYEYFVKPVDLNDLKAGILRALEYRRLVLENKAYQKDLENKVAQRTRELRQKVEDLEARDALLHQLLSIQEPEATLGLSVKLAAGLCGAHFGALYIPNGDVFLLRAASGFGQDGVLDAGALADLSLGQVVATGKILAAVKERKSAVVLPRTDDVRKGFGLGSLGVLPVYKGESIVAFLEVGRRVDEKPLTHREIQRLEAFLPYVAMAVDDCVLQESIPEWGGDVDELLDESEKWTS